MVSNFRLRNISHILQKEFSIQDKNERKAFINLFISMISDNIQGVLDKDNNFENIILKEWSNFRKLITKIMWLSWELIDSLDKFLKKDDFFESENLFSSLRDFIVSNYGNTIDLIVYKHNLDKNNLEYFAWNQQLDIFAWNQQLGIFDISLLNKFWYKNELNSLLIDYPYSKFNNTDWWWLFCKKISINFKNWDNIKKEEYILSFHANPNTSDFNETNIDINIRRLIKLFQKNSLSNLLETKLSLINAKYKDPLTWAFNKDYATEVFKRKKWYSIIFIDVNNFKNVNDTYWHDFWDKVLKEITRILNLSIRPQDKVCRNWWDEFIILASTNSELILKSIEERIHENLKNWYFVCELGCDKKWQCDKMWLRECISNKFQDISVSTWIALYDYSAKKLLLEEMVYKADKEMLDKKDDKGKEFRVYEAWDLVEDPATLLRIRDFFNAKITTDYGRESLIHKILENIKDKKILKRLEEFFKTKKEEVS